MIQVQDIHRLGSLVVVLAVLLVVSLGAVVTAQAEADPVDQLADKLEQPFDPHPRLFLTDPNLVDMAGKIEEDPLLGKIWDSIRMQADGMLELAPVERDQVGRRLLGVSRTVLKRVAYLAFAYRLSNDDVYLDRAEQEMLAAAGFTDWNPSHFLDVAEMTAALALGYDWLYKDLGEASREKIREAIVEKGLRASIDEEGWWVTTTNNWSQVSHGGLTMGALAVIEHEPELAGRVIRRTLENIHLPMDVYGPNGAYPEGPGYWAYGTNYNVLLIDALESALGSDFGLAGHQRFMASADYYLHVHGPTTKLFNYSDNSERSSLSPSMFWFASQLDRPELLWLERLKLKEWLEREQSAEGASDRLLPFLLIWASPLAEVPEPGALHYKDTGKAPVGIHRSGWDESASYVGIKAGQAKNHHGQMDTGSFVMEADGIRWAVDLGVQSYHGLEAVGIDLWNMNQRSSRWDVFRLNNLSKNTLVVDGQLQRVDGYAPITRFSEEPGNAHTVIDMGEVYAGQLAASERGVALLAGGEVIVQDEVTALDNRAEVRWGMVTEAEVEIVDGQRAVLSQGGERLGLHLLEPQGAILEIYETAEPPAEHDEPNPGTQMIGFKVTLDPNQQRRLVVQLNPGGLAESMAEDKPLEEW